MFATDTPVRRPHTHLAPRPPEGPIDLRSLCRGGEGTLALDVGFGRGRSMRHWCQSPFPGRVLGVEIKAKLAHTVAGRLRSQGHDAIVWAADVREVLRRSQGPGCIARCTIHFPDPWWKKRHEKRLVVASDFLCDLARLMPSGGQVLVQTDVAHRAAQYHDAFACAAGFSPRWIDHNPWGIISNRECRAELDGLPIHRILATRDATPL